ISRPLGRVTHAYPRSIVRPRRFSSAHRSGSIPVIRMIRDDFPWSTWPAVAMTRSSPLTSTLVVEVVALQRVQDRPREIVQLLVRDGADVEDHVAVLDPAEDRRGPAAETGGDRRRIGNLHPHAPRREREPGERAPGGDRIAPDGRRPL